MSDEHFSEGTEIEVSSNDVGFRGSWYAATVVKPPTTPTPGKSRRTASKLAGKSTSKVVVEYKTLMADDAGTKPLRETLDTNQIRPKPPGEGVSEPINFSDEVDAYYNDGWWEGVVTEVLENSRYKVYFRGTKEQLEFEESRLRVHREWVKGSWIPPPPPGEENTTSKDIEKTVKVPAKEKYSKGTLIEVSSDDEGFEGSWFSATVVKALAKNKFLVEYLNLRTDDDSEFLREEVDSQHIRPCPPEVAKADGYSLLEEVDAFYNDAWWVGVISKVFSGGRYIVFFRYSNEEMEFSHADLRPHQDWIDGNWVFPSKALRL